MKRSDGAAIGLLTLLAVAWAWPVAARLAIAIPGSALDHDVATIVWNVSWVQEAIETHQSLLRSDDVLLPFGADLRLHTYGLLPAARRTGEQVAASDAIVSRDLDDVIGLTRAGHVVVHRDMMDAESAQRIVGVLDAHPRLDRSAIEQDLVVYRVTGARGIGIALRRW